MRISDWSSDVCSSDLFDRFAIGRGGVADAPAHAARRRAVFGGEIGRRRFGFVIGDQVDPALTPQLDVLRAVARDQRETHRFEHRLENALFGRRKFRSEEHTSELQSLMRNSYAVFCLKKNKTANTQLDHIHNKIEYKRYQ